MTSTEYDERLSEWEGTVGKKIRKAADDAWLEIQKNCEKETETAKRLAERINKFPCSVCGDDKFVMKYRNVHGSVSGHFSLFGGSITGSVDGKTETSPVLSCRKCENERKVSLWNYTHDWKKLESMMPKHYRYIDDVTEAHDFLKKLGMEATVVLAERLFLPDENEDPRKMSEETLKRCGLERKFPPKPEKPPLYGLMKFLGI